MYTCGNNAFGQLGYFTVSECSDVPRKVSLGKNVSGDEMRFVIVGSSFVDKYFAFHSNMMKKIQSLL